MSRIEVITGEITAAAKSLRAAADEVAQADPSGDLAELRAAMRGSESAGAAGTLQAAWEGRFAKWNTDAVEEERALRQSAAEYDASDLRADQRARAAEARMGRMGVPR